jgi:transcriptional regulator with XRE-family HTH domain
MKSDIRETNRNWTMRTVEHLLEQTGLTIEDVAARAGLTPERVEAIADGRWTPSPTDRARIAAAFGVPVEEVSWGHTMNPRNIRYGRFGLKENF